jgi:hypothetical protein
VPSVPSGAVSCRPVRASCRGAPSCTAVLRVVRLQMVCTKASKRCERAIGPRPRSSKCSRRLAPRVLVVRPMTRGSPTSRPRTEVVVLRQPVWTTQPQLGRGSPASFLTRAGFASTAFGFTARSAATWRVVFPGFSFPGCGSRPGPRSSSTVGAFVSSVSRSHRPCSGRGTHPDLSKAGRTRRRR